MKDIKGLFFRDAKLNSIGHIVAEVWKDYIYHPFLNGKKDLTIIDAGANVGFTAFYFSEYAKVVHCIEPAKEHLEVLKKMIEFNGLENIVKPHNFALSIKDDVGELTHYSNTTMYSLYSNIKGNELLSVTGKEPTVLKRLDTFFKEEKIEHCDFLKLDVEGVEFEILGSDSFANVASKIDQMVVEVHQYSDRNPNQIVDSLRLRGFEVLTIPNQALLFYAKRTGFTG
jgi:FkbM family methyltransferase